jgi:hypothetical protein
MAQGQSVFNFMTIDQSSHVPVGPRPPDSAVRTPICLSHRVVHKPIRNNSAEHTNAVW